MLSDYLLFFFFNDTATTEIYTLSLHDALPIYPPAKGSRWRWRTRKWCRPRGETPPATAPRRPCPGSRETGLAGAPPPRSRRRSEEHTSELQSRQYLVCRLLLEKKKKKK